MLGTDSLEDVAAFTAAQRVSTQNVHVMPSGDDIPKLFELNRRLFFALSPQDGCALSTDRNPGWLCLSHLGRVPYEIVSHFEKSHGVWPIIDHEGR